MRPLLIILVCTAAVLAAPALAQAPTAGSRLGRDAGDAASVPVGQVSAATLGSVDPRAFVDNAARSDMYEIAAARLAERRSTSAGVKAFAARMIRDHSRTTRMLKAHLPAGVHAPAGLDKRRSGMLDDLRASTSTNFDRRYVDQQVAAHREALTLMQGFASRGDNPELKRLAADTVPMIQMHLDMARKLAANHGF